MTATTIDLDAYLRRIGYTGAREPTLETLQALHALHTETFAFENLNPLLGWPVRLDARSLEDKLVHGGRGGYCFEQNFLFSHVLQALGFRVAGLAARVLWNMPEDSVTPRTHMLLRVDIDGQIYIADVGFGGQTLTAPLRLEPDVEQATPHEPFRIVRVGDDFRMQSKIGVTWRTLYRFDLQEQVPADFEIINYYLSASPASRFRNGIFLARPAPGRRYGLLNNQLSIHHVNGTTERHLLTSVAEVRGVIQEIFRITPPDGPELDAAVSRYIADVA